MPVRAQELRESRGGRDDDDDDDDDDDAELNASSDVGSVTY